MRDVHFSYTEQTFPHESFDKWEKNRYNSRYVMRNKEKEWRKNMQTWEANVRRVVPYTPGEQPDHQDMIKLNTNENPYPPAPGVQKALCGIEPESLRLYPDPAADDLVKAIAEACGVKKQQVFVGVGSDDVLAMSFLTFFNGKKPILFPDITYSFL